MAIINNVFTHGSGAPASTPSATAVAYYYRSSNQHLYVWDGSAWQDISAGGGFANPMTTPGDIILGGTAGTPGRLAKGADSTVLTVDPSTHLPVWAAASGGSITVSSTHISADVTMTSANTFYDGPSLSLAAGTWFVTARLTTVAFTNATNMTTKLWDGTTVIDAQETTIQSGGAWHEITVTATVVLGGTTTIKVSVANNQASNKILASPNDNATGCSNLASGMVALKIA